MLKRRKNETGWASAKTLSEALPFIQRYSGKTIVIKFGGNAMGDAELMRAFANDVVLLKQFGIRPVIVHGGGPQIGTMLKRLGIKSEFKDGLRVSDLATVEVAEMVLSGAINKNLVAAINRAGGRAVGLSGRDAGLIRAKKLRDDLGFAGQPEATDISVLGVLAKADPGFIPVVSPISGGAGGEIFNVNADTAAGVLAGALGAARLMLLTDVEGVMDEDGHLLTSLSPKDVETLINDGTAKGGMIPKLKTAVNALEAGVEAVVILDGRRSHGLLVELFTDQGAGTLIS
ncbi:MAG TPA: acetylglutamate kinase [Hellea balneolensis]|uniref:Acetylglutamate kinase n=1 Tax=Hellea balneolensis TaxID=287478 RepID=A0A7V5NXL9_9PROT|nr:acetylglutamate kinase [Hellea balneolensis]